MKKCRDQLWLKQVSQMFLTRSPMDHQDFSHCFPAMFPICFHICAITINIAIFHIVFHMLQYLPYKNRNFFQHLQHKQITICWISSPSSPYNTSNSSMFSPNQVFTQQKNTAVLLIGLLGLLCRTLRPGETEGFPPSKKPWENDLSSGKTMGITMGKRWLSWIIKWSWIKPKNNDY